MLTLNIKRVSTLRNIPNLLRHLTQSGFSPAVANRMIKNSDTGIKFRHLEKLCLILHCTPNDLIQWQPTENSPISESEPIKSLNHAQTTDIANYLSTATIEELTQVYQNAKTKEKL